MEKISLKPASEKNLFPNFHPESKVWIYQADRELTKDEVVHIIKEGNEFVRNWQAHGKPLRAGFHVLDDYFVLLSVDANAENASGCSIDSSMHFIKSIESKYKISFTNRLLVATQKNDSIKLYPLTELIEKVGNKDLPSDTIIYNNSISKLSQIAEEWQQKVYLSWVMNLCS